MQQSSLQAAPGASPVCPAPTVRRVLYRHSHFKLGLWGLTLATIMFIVAFFSPAWANRVGLWVSCTYTSCRSNMTSGPAWLDAARAVEVLALTCFLLSLGLELCQDVLMSPPPPESKAVEIIGVAAGVFGVTGAAVFGGALDKSWVFGSRWYSDFVYLNWAFWLAAAGSVLGLLSAVLMGTSRVRHYQLTKRALTNLGVFTAPPNVPSAPMQPLVMTYPHVSAAAAGTGAQEMPASQATAAQGLPTSLVPMCLVSVQGQLVQVYQERPLAVTAASATGSEATQAPPVNVQPSPCQ